MYALFDNLCLRFFTVLFGNLVLYSWIIPRILHGFHLFNGFLFIIFRNWQHVLDTFYINLEINAGSLLFDSSYCISHVAIIQFRINLYK